MQRNTYFGSGVWTASGTGYLLEGYFCSGVPADVQEHDHDVAHVVFLLNAGYVSAAVRAPEVTAGPAIIFNPVGTEHRDRFVHGEAAYLTVSLTPAFGEYFSLPKRPAYLESFDAARRACLLHGTGLHTGSVGFGAADGAIITLLDCALGLDGRAAPDSSLVSRVKALLRDPEQPASTISELASTLNTHPVHLARVFRKSQGCSPSEFRASARATRAAELLRRTSRSISDIAYELGFADHAHLSRDFRRIWGVSPIAYRRAA
jgi:AraC family transcriptional regulator